MTIKFSSYWLKYQSENEQQSFNPQTPWQNFSLQYNIKQKSDKNKENLN